MIGAVSAVTVVAGVVVYEVIVLVAAPSSEPARRPPPLASYGTSVERRANELPGFASGRPVEQAVSFPLIRLIDPERTYTIEGDNPGKLVPEQPAPKKKWPALPSATTKADAPGAKTEAPTDTKVAKLTTPEVKISPTAEPQAAPPRLDQWRITTTSKASYFNLGGHVDRAGIVDSLATGHLRDALKVHRNFSRLPPDIRTHILTQNINLPKIAPYRGLLGIDDRTMESEQGIRFERIASR